MTQDIFTERSIGCLQILPAIRGLLSIRLLFKSSSTIFLFSADPLTIRGNAKELIPVVSKSVWYFSLSKFDKKRFKFSFRFSMACVSQSICLMPTVAWMSVFLTLKPHSKNVNLGSHSGISFLSSSGNSLIKPCDLKSKR